MWFHVLACDFDGTLATDGQIAPETMAALRRVRESGRRVVLVTGRQFADLLAVCPNLDFFDLVVAENGAVLFDPRAKQVEDLAEPPPARFLTALEHLGVPFSTGRIIVSSVVPHETAILEAIRTLGLELHIIFNKESVMVLPGGVSKESGLRAALHRLGISRHNTIGVGDAENDHAFLHASGFSVALANAVPALRETADLVTKAPNGAGVRELIDGPLRDDLEAYRPHLLERTIELGTDDTGAPVWYPVLGPSLLITGASGSGKSTLTGVLVERLVRRDYVVCLLDPEGDYRTLAEHEGIVRLTSEAGTEATQAEEVESLLRHRSTSVAIDLSALDREGRIRAAARFLHAIQRLRAETGAPHWVVVDEAHHVFPPGGSPAQEMFDFEWRGVCLVTNEPEQTAPEVLRVARHVLSTSIGAVTRTFPLIAREQVPGGELESGEALDIVLVDGAPAQVRRFRVARRETEHRRHVKKYATGRLPPERSFRFRGPDGALDLVAHNLETFTMLVKGVDDATWRYHLANGDIARWLREEIKDPALADEIRALEADPDVQRTREAVLAAIGRRYTPVARPGDERGDPERRGV
jgi:hydroxymethylpyrimidine pyrophosphatase-like HAD family hydrolase